MYPTPIAAPVTNPITGPVQRTGLAIALCLYIGLAQANTEPTGTEVKPAAAVPAMEPVATPPATHPEQAVPAADTAVATEAVETATPPSADSGTPAGAPEAGAAPATAEATAPPDPAVSPGMQIPVDGTTLDAFNASLAEIKKKTTAAEYTSLVNAIDYLLVYDLGARRDRAKLAANLNGMTAVEIIDQVLWGRQRGKKASASQTQAPPGQVETEPTTPDGQ